MQSKRTKYALLLIVLALLIIDIYLVREDLRDTHRKFTFAVFDVGQGDALFIESPTGSQILIDAGPPRKISGQLSKVMSPFDRTFDAFIFTHPDQDHIGGFLDLLKRYEVGAIFEPGAFSDYKTFQNLDMEITKRQIPKFLARKGMRIHLGDGAYLDILFPDRDVSTWNTNDASVVSRLVYGNFSAILTGDTTAKTEKIILSENPSLDFTSAILKVAHHGSRYSSSKDFIRSVAPKYALISVGGDNSYGHPHPDVLTDLEAFGAEVLRTDILGTIIATSDGLNTSFSFAK